MNIQEMHSWFDVLQDKGDSPYFTVAEKTQFLNRAQTKFVNDVIAPPAVKLPAIAPSEIEGMGTLVVKSISATATPGLT